MFGLRITACADAAWRRAAATRNPPSVDVQQSALASCNDSNDCSIPGGSGVCVGVQCNNHECEYITDPALCAMGCTVAATDCQVFGDCNFVPCNPADATHPSPWCDFDDYTTSAGCQCKVAGDCTPNSCQQNAELPGRNVHLHRQAAHRRALLQRHRRLRRHRDLHEQHLRLQRRPQVLRRRLDRRRPLRADGRLLPRRPTARPAIAARRVPARRAGACGYQSNGNPGCCNDATADCGGTATCTDNTCSCGVGREVLPRPLARQRQLHPHCGLLRRQRLRRARQRDRDVHQQRLRLHLQRRLPRLQRHLRRTTPASPAAARCCTACPAGNACQSAGVHRRRLRLRRRRRVALLQRSRRLRAGQRAARQRPRAPTTSASSAPPAPPAAATSPTTAPPPADPCLQRGLRRQPVRHRSLLAAATTAARPAPPTWPSPSDRRPPRSVGLAVALGRRRLRLRRHARRLPGALVAGRAPARRHRAAPPRRMRRPRRRRLAAIVVLRTPPARARSRARPRSTPRASTPRSPRRATRRRRRLRRAAPRLLRRACGSATATIRWSLRRGNAPGRRGDRAPARHGRSSAASPSLNRLEIGVDLPFVPYQLNDASDRGAPEPRRRPASAISRARSRASSGRRIGVGQRFGLSGVDRRLVPDRRLRQLHGRRAASSALPPRRRVAVAPRAGGAQRRLRRARRARLRRSARRLAVRNTASAWPTPLPRGFAIVGEVRGLVGVEFPKGAFAHLRRRRRPSSPPACAGARASASRSTPPSASACRAATACPIARAPSSASSTRRRRGTTPRRRRRRSSMPPPVRPPVAPPPPPPDADEDGVPDDVDQCPAQPRHQGVPRLPAARSRPRRRPRRRRSLPRSRRPAGEPGLPRLRLRRRRLRRSPRQVPVRSRDLERRRRRRRLPRSAGGAGRARRRPHRHLRAGAVRARRQRRRQALVQAARRRRAHPEPAHRDLEAARRGPHGQQDAAARGARAVARARGGGAPLAHRQRPRRRRRASSAEGFGADRPIADNRDFIGRAKNRRIEFVDHAEARHGALAHVAARSVACRRARRRCARASSRACRGASPSTAADGVPLHLGDTYLEPPPMGAREALAASAADWRYGAPAGEAPLLAALDGQAARAERPRLGDRAAHLQVTVGATGALAAAARAVVDPGDEVICPTPHWPLIRGIVTNAGGLVVEVPLSQALYADARADAAAILEPHVTPRTAALYVTTPNNPDGKQLGRAPPRAARRAGAPPRSVGPRRRGLRGSRLGRAAPVDRLAAGHGRAHADRLLAVQELRHRRAIASATSSARRRRCTRCARSRTTPSTTCRRCCNARRWRSSPRRRRAPGSTETQRALPRQARDEASRSIARAALRPRRRDLPVRRSVALGRRQARSGRSSSACSMPACRSPPASSSAATSPVTRASASPPCRLSGCGLGSLAWRDVLSADLKFPLAASGHPVKL